MNKFKIKSNYHPSGDQPQAIEELSQNIINGDKDQMLLGITGSGKTFTMANVIEKTGKPALIMAHNKTLAGQIYSELKELFPENAVEYFISYYDYYQPEAYIARTDTYIEKDASINEQIDLMRHRATRSLLERRDVIVVASVSCIYGLGSPELYSSMNMLFDTGKEYNRNDLLKQLIALQYKRNDVSFERGCFRIRGENIDIFPAHYQDKAWRLSFFGDELEAIYEIDSLTNQKLAKLQTIVVYANSHFVTPENIINNAIKEIKQELGVRLAELDANGKHVESARLKSRTNYDIEMLTTTGTCKGIENYSRFLTGSKPGDPPPTLYEYLPKDALLFIDESHVTIPQIRAMYNGDRARKTSLVEHGFRLPAALDNRPLKFEEWLKMRPQTIYVSATPSDFELDKTNGVVTELIIRPTGLIDPECIIRPADTQVEDLIHEININIKKGERVLVTSLTKKMAEDLSKYLLELKIKCTYLHSSVLTLERAAIINDLKSGKIDVLVGVNLLREGLDIPECSLVAILDADKEGFLRSTTSLIQTIGRAARNVNGRAILYANKMTDSIKQAVEETNRRRKIQIEYNKKHNITPKTIISKIHSYLEASDNKEIIIDDKIANNKEYVKINKDKQNLFNIKDITIESYKLPNQILMILTQDEKMQNKFNKYIEKLKNLMRKSASDLDFETASKIRDYINYLNNNNL